MPNPKQLKDFRAEMKAAGPRPRISRGEERALIAAARRGDERALARLLRSLADPALRFGRTFCRHAEDAEDVMQEVLASLARGLPRFRGESALSTWAYRVARHACLRRRGPRARALEPLHDGEAASAPAGAEADPARAYERRELAARIERAIEALPRPQREVLVLRDVEGLTAAEVGRVLGLGERAVKSRLHRARLTLRRALAPAAERSPAGGARSRAVARRKRCPDTARLVSRYLEGDLGPDSCAALFRHVQGCADCGETCRALRSILRTCRRFGRRPLPGPVRERIRESVRDLAGKVLAVAD